MKNKIRSVFNFILLLVITGLVLYFALKDDYEMIIYEIFNINVFWLIAAFLLVISYWLFRAITVRKLAITFNSNYTFSKAMRLVVETNFFHAVTPFSSGGQPYEVYSFKKENIKITDATNISIQNFIVYQVALVLLGMIAFVINYFCHLFSSSAVLEKLVALGFFINTFVIVILFVVTFGKKINKKLINGVIHLLYKLKFIKNEDIILKKSDSYLSEFHMGAKLLLKDKIKFIKLIGFQFISLCCLYLVPLCLLYGTGNFTAFTPVEAIVTSAYVMLIGSFVPIPGGTGGLEYGFVAFYGNFITGGSLKAIMLLWRFITYYFGMIVGAVVLNIRKK